MKTKKYLIVLISGIFGLFFQACEGEFSPNEILGLEIINLQTPANVQTCLVEGRVGDKWEVRFVWEPQPNDFQGQYTFAITPENESTETQRVDGTSLIFEVDQAKKFTWSVSAVNENGNEIQSNTWEFFTPAPQNATSPPLISTILVVEEPNGQFGISCNITDDDIVQSELFINGVSEGIGTNAIEVTRPLQNGSNTLRVEAQDESGNTSTVSRSYTVQ